MAIWLIRAGKHGEFEQKFIQENRVYVTWDKLANDLAKLEVRKELYDLLQKYYPDANPNRLENWARQIWPFAHEMKRGDLVVLPLKSQPSVYIGEVTGEYQFDAKGPNPFYHWRSIKWIGEAIPRSHFGQDLLYTFGAFLTICRVQRNNAEERILQMRKSDWKPEGAAIKASATDQSTDAGTEYVDVEQVAGDQIAQYVRARFKGHDLARLVEGILKAQGYTTYRSPEGPDGGVDILAGAGPLGFGSPRLCVQVKSQDAPVGRPDIDQLLGVMDKVRAPEGLFVSWSGFRQRVFKEMSPSFFRVRLWTQKELLEQLFANYDRLDDDLKAELPLKRIWTIAAQEEQ